MSSRYKSRHDDEIVLAMLRARAAGASTTAIAARFGFARGQAVSTILYRVFRDDIARSGEPRDVVRRAYPWSLS